MADSWSSPLRIASTGGWLGSFQCAGLAIWLAGLAALRGAIRAAAGVHSAYGVTVPRPGSSLVDDPRGGDRPSCPGRRPGVDRAPLAPQGSVAALDVSTSVNFCSSSASVAAIYLPPFRQGRPFAYGRRVHPLGTGGNVASRAKLTQSMYSGCMLNLRLSGYNDHSQ